MLSLIAVLALGILIGSIAALKVIAPKTKTTVDDKLLSAAEKVEPYVEKFVKKD